MPHSLETFPDLLYDILIFREGDIIIVKNGGKK